MTKLFTSKPAIYSLAAAFCMVVVVLIFLAAGSLQVQAADARLPDGMANHYVALTTIPSSPTDIYTKSVWLKSIELIPQSTTSPNCTIQDKAGTPNVVYNAIPLSPNHSYRDERTDTSPLFMSGGITWSCTDTTVKAQLIVKY